MDTGGSLLSSTSAAGPDSSQQAAAPLSFCVFDLETSGLEKDSDIRCGVVWSSKNNWTRIYRAGDILGLVADLEAADVVISYNGKGYDRWVLASFIERQVVFQRHIDLFQFIADQRPAFEKGWKLDDVAQRLWGLGKGRPSSEIVSLWDIDPQLVIDHCMWDVYLTRCLFEHLRDEQWLLDPQLVRFQPEVPEWWRKRLVLPRSTVPVAAVTCL